MRTKTISISERNLMFVIAGQLFDQAPNRQPRKAEIIMQKVRDSFRKDAYNDNEFYSLMIAESAIHGYLKDLLMEIPEFTELNLSQVEFENNVDVEDESRAKFSFVTRYDKHDYESWKRDFIDLDAFIRNVHNRLITMMETDQDCFCCTYEGMSNDIEPCKTCLVNPLIEYRFKGTRRPKGKYTFSCKYDCPAHCQICCEECKRKDSCANKCDGESGTCGNKVLE